MTAATALLLADRLRQEIAAKEQRAAALQAEALRLFAEADEQRRLLELYRLELP